MIYGETELPFEKIVVFGSFNPHIIEPQWLANQEIWVASEIQYQTSSKPQSDVTFSGEDTYWRVTPKELSIESKRMNPGELVCSVLKQLPHTPVKALNSVFTFSLPNDVVSPINEAMSSTDFGLEPVLHQWGIVSHDGNKRIAISVSFGEEGNIVTVSNHRNTRNTESVITAASEFEADRCQSIELINKIFG